jgi:hypothetical protein
MDIERLERFKRESLILIETSAWLVEEIQNVLDQETYYENNPHLDTYELMEQRLNKMDELEQRSMYENNLQQKHHAKFSDLYNTDI